MEIWHLRSGVGMDRWLAQGMTAKSIGRQREVRLETGDLYLLMTSILDWLAKLKNMQMNQGV